MFRVHYHTFKTTRAPDPFRHSRTFQSTARSHRRQIARKCRQMTARIQRHALALKNRTKDASSSRAPRPIPPARAPCNADSARTCVRACSHHHSSNTPDASSSALRETTRAHTHAVSHAPNIRRASRIVVVVVVDHRTHRPRWHPRTRPHRRARLSPRARASSRRPRAPCRASAPTSDAPRVESPWCAGVTIGQNTPSACTSARAVGARSRGVSARRGVRRRRPGAPHAFHAPHAPRAVATARRETS